jgi:hypothetical protein
MRVKDLIKYLEKQNPESIAILRDFGQDTGDITFFQEDKFEKLSDGVMESNLRIISYDKILDELKRKQHYDVEEFIEKYGRE